MRGGFGIVLAALAASKKPTTWLIDGNNFLGQRGTPRDEEVLAEKLKPVAVAETVILVYDGKTGDSRNELSEGNFRHIKLEEGLTADDFILEEIQTIASESKQNRVKLVTADKRLRSSALDSRPTVKTVVNPKVFWRKYYPRMAGLKKMEEEIAES